MRLAALPGLVFECRFAAQMGVVACQEAGAQLEASRRRPSIQAEGVPKRMDACAVANR